MATFAQFKAFGPFESNGALVSAGFVYHYAAGTTTLLDVYTDRAKSTTAAQPLAMDANGVAACYCDGIYKFEIQDSAGNTLYTFDNVSVVDQTTATGKGANLTSASTLTLGVDGDEFVVTGTTTINALSGNQSKVTLVFNGSLTLTQSGNLILQDLRSYTTQANDVFTFVNEGSSVWREVSRGNAASFAYPRSYLAGLTLSTAGGSATFSVAAGACRNSADTKNLILAAALSKTTSAWVVGTGNGGVDTGVIANTTWYHVYLIKRSDTGVVDVLVSLSASAPTLPTNYDLKRRIGAMKTDGSAQWVLFVQDGDLFEWAAPVADITASTPGSTAVLRTLSIPLGVNVVANVVVGIIDTASVGQAAYLSDPAVTDGAVSGASTTVNSNNTTTATYVTAAVRSNTSSQIRSRCSSGVATTTIAIATMGWLDRRGRDS